MESRREIGTGAAAGLAAAGVVLVSGAFLVGHDPWLGMAFAMVPLLPLGLLLRAVRRRFRPSWQGLLLGLVSAAALYGITVAVVKLLGLRLADLYAWQSGHGLPFLLVTLVLIILAEEVLWRGVLTRWAVDRWGRAPGIVVAAAIYALAHVASMNPLLPVAAFGIGICWGALYEASDSLVPPVVCHLSWDALVLFAAPLA